MTHAQHRCRPSRTMSAVCGGEGVGLCPKSACPLLTSAAKRAGRRNWGQGRRVPPCRGDCPVMRDVRAAADARARRPRDREGEGGSRTASARSAGEGSWRRPQRTSVWSGTTLPACRKSRVMWRRAGVRRRRPRARAPYARRRPVACGLPHPGRRGVSHKDGGRWRRRPRHSQQKGRAGYMLGAGAAHADASTACTSERLRRRERGRRGNPTREPPFSAPLPRGKRREAT